MLDAAASFKNGPCALALSQRRLDEASWQIRIPRGENLLYREKASYFDDQVESPWASDPYGPSELAKLDRCSHRQVILRDSGFLSRGAGRVA